MTGRAAAASALAGSGVLLLATTQPWARTVVEVAAGAPRRPGTLGAAELAPWLAPLVLVTALAVIGGLSGMRWARPLAGAASLAVLAGAVWATVLVTTGAPDGEAVVASSPTGWLWVATGAALTAATGTVAWWAPWRRTPPTRRPSRADGQGDAGSPDGDAPRDGIPRDASSGEDPDGAEAERRRLAADWRDLSAGLDPTDPEGHGRPGDA